MTSPTPDGEPGASGATAERPLLQVVIASTRPGRIGMPVGQWASEHARAHGAFEVELVDLLKVGLPMMDEPNHPRLAQYTKEHTKAWSATVSRADAFVFVVPEYNYGCAPAIVNALDYLFHEWNYKPVGFVSYGGVSAGTRGVQMLKQVVTTLKLVALPEAVSIPFVQQLLEDGVLRANEVMDEAMTTLLDELVRWAGALRPLRAASAPAGL